jgi:hypothetical protein
MLGCLDTYLKTRAQSISVHFFSGRVFFGFSAPRTTAEKARSKEAGIIIRLGFARRLADTRCALYVGQSRFLGGHEIRLIPAASLSQDDSGRLCS